MSRYAFGWIALALELEAENARLRAAVLELAIALTQERELFCFAGTEIERRWPEGTAT